MFLLWQVGTRSGPVPRIELDMSAYFAGMDGGESGRQLCDSLAPGGSGTLPGGKRRLIRGGGSASRISNGLRPQDPSGGEGWLISSRDEVVVLPVANAGCGGGGAGHDHAPRVWGDAERPVLRLAGSRSTRQSVGLHSGAVKVSTVSVDVTRKRVDRPVSTSAFLNGADRYVDFADAGGVPGRSGSVAGGVTGLTEPVHVGTDEMTFPQECDVRSCSVFGDYGEADCVGCTALNAWCNEMPEVRVILLLSTLIM